MKDKKKSLYALINIAKNQIGLEEDIYRDILKNHGAKKKDGKYSLTTMKQFQLEDVVKYLEKCGFKKQSGKRPRISKIKAILKDSNLPKSYANNIAKRMYGADDYTALSDWQLRGIITALRKGISEKKVIEGERL